MKKSISILFCLFMFPLFINTSQVNAQSSIPSCLAFQSGDHAARIECFQKNEKKFRARIIELRRKHNIEQVNYDSFGESCPSRSPGDHAARLECFKNNDNAYQATINELMATKEGSAVDFNNEAQRFQESTTEGQHIQQLEAKILDLEVKLTNAVSPSMYDQAVRLNKDLYDQLSEANIRYSDLESKLSVATATQESLNTRIADLEAKLEMAVLKTVYDDAVRLNAEQQALLTKADTKISDLEGELAIAAVKVQRVTDMGKEISCLHDRITNVNRDLGGSVGTKEFREKWVHYAKTECHDRINEPRFIERCQSQGGC
ncbi:hypothetical protein OAL04_07700 [Nitrospinae bacterium]|nr:hypothetical protein [Nitrospinota bacterium]